jgi:hypothetical protein
MNREIEQIEKSAENRRFSRNIISPSRVSREKNAPEMNLARFNNASISKG